MGVIVTRARLGAPKLVAVAAVTVMFLGLVASRRSFAGTEVPGGNPTSYVSGLGDDANPCSRTAPCKTWKGATAKTNTNGQVIALDVGNFDGGSSSSQYTIDDAVTIDGMSLGTTNVSMALDGIIVAAGATDVVTLRNLTLRGYQIGLHGIDFVSGAALRLENVVIEGFTLDGVHVEAGAGPVVLDDVTISGNGQNGVSAVGSGVSALASVIVRNSSIEGNAGAGVLAADYTDVTVDHTTLTGNLEGLACVPQDAGNCLINARSDLIHANTTGVLCGRGSSSSTALATVTLAENTIVANRTSMSLTVNGHGLLNSFGDNTVTDNKFVRQPTAIIAKI